MTDPGTDAKLDKILEQLTQVRVDVAEVKTSLSGETRRVDVLERRMNSVTREPLATKAELDEQGDQLRREMTEKAAAERVAAEAKATSRNRWLIAWIGSLTLLMQLAFTAWDHLR